MLGTKAFPLATDILLILPISATLTFLEWRPLAGSNGRAWIAC